jgi:hypothetical protein
MGLENFGKYIWSNFSNPIYESVARLRKFAPQRRKERKEEKKKEEKQILLQHLPSCSCLSLRSLRLCGARVFYYAILSLLRENYSITIPREPSTVIFWPS